MLCLPRGNEALGYRDILRSKLEERAKVNVRYSLRAFARDLGISSSRLSAVIRGKQGLSRNYAEQIATRLGFNPSESEYFCQLVLSEDARSKRAREIARERLEAEFQEKPAVLSEDAYKLIADWHHVAIRQLLRIETSEVKNIAYIAKRLGVTEFVVEQALSRLEKMGYVAKAGEGYTHSNGDIHSTDGTPSDAIVKHHQQILDKAQEALVTQTAEERFFSSYTLALSTANLAKFKDELNKFIDNFNRNVEHQNKINPPDEVYTINTGLFRLSHKNKDKA